MEFSIEGIRRPVRRRLQRVVQKSKDADYVRRAMAILHLAGGYGVSATAKLLYAARSSVQRWRGLFEEYGEDGLAPLERGRPTWSVTPALITALKTLLENSPNDYGYLRSRWSSELLALVVAEKFGLVVHASTIRRLLPEIGMVYRRARPILCLRDPQRNRKLRAIDAVLARRRRGVEVFYVDEADVDFNPRIGAQWTPRGQQVEVPTPGKNIKHYLAGALHAQDGRVIWVEHPRKNSELFLRLLEALLRAYRSARTLVLILDNYVIHKSASVQAWLARHPKVQLLFQPTYSPWVNQIERLWKTLHDTITRNHRCSTFRELAQRIIRFLQVVQPFPGNQQALATLRL
jgi:putative transposase